MNSIAFEQPIDRAAARRRSIALGLAAALISMLYGFSLAHAVSWLLLLSVPVALAVSLAALAAPELGAIILLGVAWGYISDAAVRSYHIPSMIGMLFGLLLITLALRRMTGRAIPLTNDAVTWWMLGYFFVICLGLGYATAPDQTQLMVIDFAKIVVLYLLLITFIRSTPTFERAMWMLLAIGALLGTITVYQELTHNYSSEFGGLARMKIAYITAGLKDRPRAGGPTGEPNAYGPQMLVLAMIGLWALTNARTLRGRLAAGYATIACLAGVELSFSRGAYIATAVALALFAIHSRLRLRYLALVALLIGFLVLNAPAEFSARASTLGNLLPGNQGVYSEDSFRERSFQMQMAINMFADHPIVGVGGWNYPVLYPTYIREYGSPVTEGEHGAHSFYLEVAAEHGLLGVITVGAILLLAFQRLRAARRLFAAAGNRRMAELAVALQIGYIGYLVSATFVHGAYSRLLWLQIAMAVALAAIARRQTAQPAPDPAPAISAPVHPAYRAS